MRIGLFTYGMHETPTGIGRYVYELAHGIQLWHPELKVTLLHPNGRPVPSWVQEFDHLILTHIKRLPSVLTVGSVLLDRTARALGLEIVHDPCGVAPFLWPKTSAYARLVTIHDAIPRLHPEWYPLPDRVLFHTVLPGARWTADMVLTVSHTSKRDLVRALGIPADRVRVTPNGVRRPGCDELAAVKRDSRFSRWRPYFLMVGDTSPRKNLRFLMSAFGEFHRLFPDVRLLLAGPRPPQWEAIPSVVHLGYVSDEDLVTLYAHACAVLHPSLYEGFGLPALEAMAYGAPVLCSNTGGLPEVTGNAAMLLDPYDPSAWTEAMTLVYRDRAVRQNLIRRGRDRSKYFTWRETVETTVQAYRSIV